MFSRSTKDVLRSSTVLPDDRMICRLDATDRGGHAPPCDGLITDRSDAVVSYPPPVTPGYVQQPPPGDWTPPPAKSKAVPILIGVLIVLVIGVTGLGYVLFVRGAEEEPPAAPAPTPLVLTEAGAQRACRTAFGQDWEARSEYATADKDGEVIAALQEIELQETWKTEDGFKVNGTIHYTLQAFPVDPVQSTIDLTCTVTGVDENPRTSVAKRG
jgi:hypothetical protein